MNLLFVRHAIALDREEWNYLGKPDAERPLSEKGIERMQQGARGLQSLVEECGAILTSPFQRARQTAQILQPLWPRAEYQECPGLSAGSANAQEISALSKSFDSESTLCIIGHEPDFSFSIAQFLAKEPGFFIEVKKGSAIFLHFPALPEAGEGTLLWSLPPKVLRGLGAE